MSHLKLPAEGGCTCGQVRYRITAKPLIVHCCHCRWCQRQTGTAFALNAIFVADDVEVIKGEVDEKVIDSPSGRGQKIARCPKCKIAIWSNYYMGGIKEMMRFIRVGSLDDPDQLPPDIHILAASKQPWVTLSPSERVVEEFYEYETTWSEESQQKRNQLLEKVAEKGAVEGWKEAPPFSD